MSPSRLIVFPLLCLTLRLYGLFVLRISLRLHTAACFVCSVFFRSLRKLLCGRSIVGAPLVMAMTQQQDVFKMLQVLQDAACCQHSLLPTLPVANVACCQRCMLPSPAPLCTLPALSSTSGHCVFGDVSVFQSSRCRPLPLTLCAISSRPSLAHTHTRTHTHRAHLHLSLVELETFRVMLCRLT